MCGIAGLVDLRRRPTDPADVELLCGRLVHRGPDDLGVHVVGETGLGQRRLSIIDLTGGRQPMANEDGSIWVTFNGEIYNFQELRPALESRGHRFATRSDTEAILHSYEERGDNCVDGLRGMFAFALWDARRRRLLLARDRVGKKPLYYAIADGRFLFASELQALVAHPSVPRAIDPTAIDDYLTYGYIPSPKTAFLGVSKLPPAHTLSLELGDDGEAPRLEVRRYWDLPYGPKLALHEHEAEEALLEQLTEAVRLRMIADVPLGALLSGGIDSSLVVALMSRLSDRPVKTFSIGFDERDFNELPYARLVAERYATDHHELIVRPDALDVLPRLVHQYGEPFADSSAVPSYYVAQLTRQHVKVALSGDGGDESFAGYERYFGSLLAETYRRVPQVVRGRLIEPLASLVPDSGRRRARLAQAKRFLNVASQPLDRRYLRWVSYFSPAEKANLYQDGFRAELDGLDAGSWLIGLLAEAHAEGASHLDALLAADVRSYLPEDLLVKMDIATMACSLEARSPLLDHKLMEFSARLPVRLKLAGRTSKVLLRRVARRLLPGQVLARRKMGFGVPVGEWMRGVLRPMIQDLLLSPGARCHDWVRPQAIQALMDAHLERSADHTAKLWSLLWLELWAREFVSGP
jgi:asparagine synthase (glutamine-hydrolysing)